MGSGKSYWGRQLSSRLALPFFDLDEAIEKNTGQSISDLFNTRGEERFRQLEKEVLTQLIEGNSSLVVSTGGGTPCFFNNMELMKQAGVVVWLNPSINLINERLLLEKDHRPLIQKLPDAELKSFILKKMNDRRLYYEQADVHVNEDQVVLENLIQSILHA